MSNYLYQQHNQFFSQHAFGSEIPAKNELIELGAENIKDGYLGYYFQINKNELYRLVYKNRISTRILAPISSFDCHSEKYLYKMAQKINWNDFLTVSKTFSIVSNVSNSKIKNSRYASYILKDAIVDQFNKNEKKRPDVNRYFPDLLLNLYIHENKARISIDLGGGSLHKRGYRKSTTSAPIKENLAASIIDLTEWDKRTPIYDPFCGSGTLLIEAAIKFTETPASLLRSKFGFLRLPEFNATTWNQTKSNINQNISSLPNNLINGSDIDDKTILKAKDNVSSYKNFSSINLKTKNFEDIEAINNSLIITNPPYGIRQNTIQEAELILTKFGDFLKQRCVGTTAFVFFGNKEIMKKIGLKPDKKIPINTGKLPGILCRYPIY